METTELRTGYIQDYVSGQAVKATPEETQAVQVFSRRLVEDYGYSKAQIQTRPQFRVRMRPSDEGKTYPVDIALFRSTKKIEDNLYLVVECKKKNRREGVAQLRLYLDMSAAELGVWFNGDEHIYLRKIFHPDGSRTYEELPNIPRNGQRIEDIGLYKRKDLKKPSNLKAVFHDIRNHLAGMTTGITRDEALAQEIINILFCKILDEQETEPDQTVTFRVGARESAGAVQKRITGLFERVKAELFGDVFSKDDKISLDAESLKYVVGELQNYCVMAADRDAIGDAFEVFIGPALRGTEGQFFTPRNVVKMVIELLDPKPGEKIIDPACGSGGFLITALEHVWTQIRTEAKHKKWSPRQVARREIEVATDCFRGVDKDAFLAKVCKAYMALVGDGRGGIFCANTLLPPDSWSPLMRDKVQLGSFDVVMTNPPFGNKIVVKGANVLSQFDLGYKWKKKKDTKEIEKTNALEEQKPPQILFIERCLQLLKPGGRLGIVIPESIIGNPSYEYIIKFLEQTGMIWAVVTMPEALFKTSGKGGTHCKVAVVFITKSDSPQDHTVFMADAKWCGHDSRSNPTIRKDKNGNHVLLDDVPLVVERYKELRKNASTTHNHLGYLMDSPRIKKRIYVPKFYNPEISAELDKLSHTHDLLRVGDLISQKIISISNGIEIGKMAYGTGKIPFIRTSDISNWEIKADFKHGVSEEIYDELKTKVDVKAGDILMVRDGTYLIGTTAIVTESDLPMLYQSHMYRIRVLKPKTLDPWLFFALLNTPILKRQIRANQFTQDIIDTIGNRIAELIIPIPRDEDMRRKISDETKEIIETRIELRNKARNLVLEIEGIEGAEDVEDELDEALEEI